MSELSAEIASLTSALNSERELRTKAEAAAVASQGTRSLEAAEATEQIRMRDAELDKLREVGRKATREAKERVRVLEGQVKRL